MEQIAVVKIYDHEGTTVRRNMMLGKDVWEDIVKNNPDKSVTWELRKAEPINVNAKIIIGTDLKELKGTKNAKSKDEEEVPPPAAESEKTEEEILDEEIIAQEEEFKREEEKQNKLKFKKK